MPSSFRIAVDHIRAAQRRTPHPSRTVYAPPSPTRGEGRTLSRRQSFSLLTRPALICPSCQSAAIGAVDLTPKSAAHLVRPVSNRGAFRDRHERETGCGGREASALDETRLMRTAKSCGPDAPTLASSFAGNYSCEATVANKPGHRGEREGNR